MALRIRDLVARDIRFPPSRQNDGSDALNRGDYSATYVVLETNDALRGHGLTFTNGRGNEVVAAAARALAPFVVGRDLAGITADRRGFYHSLAQEEQLRWLGPEKGILHMATGAVVNAVWDLWARQEGKPLWKLLGDLTPQQLVDCIDFTWITDALTPQEALALLRAKEDGRAAREAEMREAGFPAYTTSAGWLGYSDDKVRRLCEEAVAAGWAQLQNEV